MVSFLFCGDFAPIKGFEHLVIEKDALVFGELVKVIDEVDISFINLEAPACKVNEPIMKTGPALKINPGCLKSLSDAGFDVVGLANNHILDHGNDGFLETINYCQKYDLNYAGAGKNIDEAQEPIIIETNGFNTAVIAVAEHEFGIASRTKVGAAPLDPIDNIYQIEKAKKKADLVFVTIHGGNEYFPYPRPGLRKICQFFIDHGVDGVICHHAHVPGAYEFYKDKPIVYSLGNIIFDHLNSVPGWDQGYAVKLEFDERNKELTSFDILPYHQSLDYKGVKIMKGEEKKNFIEKIENYKSILSDPVKYEIEWDNFCDIKEKNMLIFNFLPNNRLMGILSKILPVKKLFLSKASISTKLNLLRCESHRELLQSIFEKIYQQYLD